ncbi:MAG: flagellin lysine-N-methylase [Selenomonadaceae bacterium]|nr:flagellin lysine-N-methylase [Selenomonadaceae bacterium]
MMKKYLYFQPEYVREFVCDGSKCGDNCCERNWNIDVDAKTFELYRRIRPESTSEKITACFGYNTDTGKYFVKDRPCPFLTEKNLCSLQLKYGENFLSETCVTYPRRTIDFGKFFERSLRISCPIVAEMILFRNEPIKFEFVEVSEQVHSHGGKIKIDSLYAGQKFAAHMLEIQIAMISILQERTLTIDQRLIVLGFFLDRLDEIICNGFDKDALKKLIDAYESKKFLAEQVPRMLSAVKFDAEKFSELLLELLVKLYGDRFRPDDKKFLDALAETFDIVPDEKNQVFVTEIAANYKRLADARKNFTVSKVTFLENFLVNELFLTCVPWKFQTSVAKNFGVFVAEYKLFELLTFSATQKNFAGDNLLKLTVWFARQANHDDGFGKIILDSVPDDIFDSLETLLDA